MRNFLFSLKTKMKRPNFIFWYYNQAVHNLLEIWKNFLHFVWHFFSIVEMFKTILSPWRRDVAIKNWRGFHPQKSLELLIGNIISRVMGAVTRSFVILFGLLILFFVLTFGLEILMLWVSAPILLLIVIYYSLNGIIILPVGIFLLSVWIALVIFAYFFDTKTPLFLMQPEQLLKTKVLEKISGRLGFSRRRFPQEILFEEQSLIELLKFQGLAKEDFAQILNWEFSIQQQKQDDKKFWHWDNLKKISPIGRQWRYGYTAHLDRYCQDLSLGDFSEYSDANLVGREDEYEMLQLLLQRPDQNCALLVGAAGIGKKTLVHALAKSAREAEENAFSQIRILNLDLARAISDAISRGEDLENFLRRLFFEAAFAGNVVLLVEHLEYFLGNQSSDFHPDISVVLNEFLNLPTFQIIALSTPKEYHKLIENHENIVKYFEVIEMREPTEQETVEILLTQLNKYERNRTLFTYSALKKIVAESGKHNWQFPLPERALDLAMDVLMFWEKKSDEQFVQQETVEAYLTLKTGVKHGEVEGAERKKLLNLEKMLHKLVIGQDEAIKQVSEALRRSRSGIGNSQKPVGSFLFLGPTGVGKTETAKALAKTYFGDEKHMVRFDMSEFQNPNSMDRLLGSAELNEPGRLTTQVKDNPYCLLLLDEIEKAYPEILNIFLQILDEGYVTDAFGEKINFRNTLIIATSNVGASLIKRMVEEKSDSEQIKHAVVDHAIENNIFRTEFLNRFDSVIFFRPLNEKELFSVVRLQLQKFLGRLKQEKNIEFTFKDDIIEKIIQKGYNPIFGARSLNRYIEDEVESMIAKKIIAGELAKGEVLELHL